MGRNQTDRVMRRIERGLVIVGAACLLWVGATSLSAVLYQVEQRVSLERPDHALDSPGADASKSRGSVSPLSLPKAMTRKR